MAKLPAPLHQTAAAIYRWHEECQRKEKPRTYLGISELGHECERYLWLKFRGAEGKQFDGRVLRLFNRGHREEPQFWTELRGIGATVHETDADGNQWSVSAIGGHCKGHMDAAATGLPEAPKTWCVVECKTHSAKSFKDLQDKGCEKSQPKHWAQMHGYMGLSGMDRALYLAANKDTDDLYCEWVHFDKVAFDKLMERAHRIVTANEPPMKISNDPAWFQCKWCEMHGQCHGTEAPLVNCRTCAHSTPELDGDGRWSCARGHEMEVCTDHRFIPILLINFAEMIDSDGVNVTYRNKLTRTTFENGEWTSEEIRAAHDKKALGDPIINEAREVFSARVAG